MRSKKRFQNIFLVICLFLTLLVISIEITYGFESKINHDKNIESINKEENLLPTNIELFEEYYDYAETILNKMSLEEKVGQLFLVRYNENVEYEIKNYYPCGYILFSKDFKYETKMSLKEKLKENNKLSNYPLIFAVDEEGGDVTRVSHYKNFRSEKFKSPQEIYKEGGYLLLEKNEKEKLNLLLDIGINLNLAPVADISVNKNDYIYDRTFGKNAEETMKYIKNMVRYANEMGISSSLKHFPGYGNNVDTHIGVAIDKRSYENFVEKDYLPFIAGIEEGVPTILVSHNIINCIDDKYPATLSEKVNAELRKKLNFSGIIITDDLAMDAVLDYVNNKNAATLAINAGNDLIITSDFISMHNEIMENIKKEIISIEKIELSVKRILAWKKAYGII